MRGNHGVVVAAGDAGHRTLAIRGDEVLAAARLRSTCGWSCRRAAPTTTPSSPAPPSGFMYALWQASGKELATELVFCDLSTPNPKRFKVYTDMRAAHCRVDTVPRKLDQGARASQPAAQDLPQDNARCA